MDEELIKTKVIQGYYSEGLTKERIATIFETTIDDVDVYLNIQIPVSASSSLI